MIHSEFIKNLTEDESCLFHATCEHVFKCMNLQGQDKWYQMMRPGVLAHMVRNISNLREEYQSVAHALASKLETYTW